MKFDYEHEFKRRNTRQKTVNKSYRAQMCWKRCDIDIISCMKLKYYCRFFFILRTPTRNQDVKVARF